MVEKPVVFLPLVWTFAPNDLPQPPQNLTVKLVIDGLTRGYEFLVDNALDVEKKININLTLLRTLHAFFGRDEFGEFHCDDCCLVAGSYPYTHVSSPVLILEMKLGSSLACC